MIHVFDTKELAARKELLVAESEIRRETLKVELQNIQLYAAGLKGKIDRFCSSGPLVLLSSLAGVLLASPFAKGTAQGQPRRGRVARIVMGSLFGLRLYRRLRPLLRFFLSRRFGRNGAETVEQEQEMPAAKIY